MQVTLSRDPNGADPSSTHARRSAVTIQLTGDKGASDLVEGSARGVLDEHACLAVRVGGDAQQRLFQGSGFRV